MPDKWQPSDQENGWIVQPAEKVAEDRGLKLWRVLLIVGLAGVLIFALEDRPAAALLCMLGIVALVVSA